MQQTIFTLARCSLLVGEEDIEAIDNVDKRDSLVTLPLLEVLDALDEDDEVLTTALVVDLCPVVVGLSHGLG